MPPLVPATLVIVLALSAASQAFAATGRVSIYGVDEYTLTSVLQKVCGPTYRDGKSCQNHTLKRKGTEIVLEGPHPRKLAADIAESLAGEGAR